MTIKYCLVDFVSFLKLFRGGGLWKSCRIKAM